MNTTLSPPPHFPLDDIELRITFIRSILNEIYEITNRILEKYHISEAVTDLEEKRMIDSAELDMKDFLVKEIQKKFPSDSIVVEDSPEFIGLNSFRWVIDPIDGSLNFVRGIPLFAISIGIQHRETNVAGVVIVPLLRDLYIGILGNGVTKNGKKIKVSHINQIENSILIYSYPNHRKKIIRELLSDFSVTISSGRSVRRTGSLVIDLCWLAEGRIDGLWEREVKFWDMSAGSIIIEEAGGKLTDFIGNKYDNFGKEFIATNGLIHDSLLKTLQKNRQDNYLN